MVRCVGYLEEGDEYGKESCSFYRDGGICVNAATSCEHMTHALTCATCGSDDPNVRYHRHMASIGKEWHTGNMGHANVFTEYCKNEDFHGKKKGTSRNYKFTEVVIRMTSLRMSKWNDYGGSFTELFQSYEWAYIVPRLVEKVKRLESLTLAGNEQQVSDEKLEDTLMDIAVICLNAITEMEMENDINNSEMED